MPTPSLFGRRLKKVREERDLTQEDLAKKVGAKSAVLISHYETGARKTPSVENLVKLANALAVSADYLLGRVDIPDEVAAPIEAVLRSGEWQETDERIRTLGELTRLWAERDKERDGNP